MRRDVLLCMFVQARKCTTKVVKMQVYNGMSYLDTLSKEKIISSTSMCYAMLMEVCNSYQGLMNKWFTKLTIDNEHHIANLHLVLRRTFS